MHVPPPAVDFLPDPGFLNALVRGCSFAGDSLIETDATNDGHITHDPYMRTAHRSIVLALNAAQFEVKLVKSQPLDQMPTGLGFKTRQARIAEVLVGFPVGTGDAVKQLLAELEQVIGGRVDHEWIPRRK
jgi:hypothetical protein